MISQGYPEKIVYFLIPRPQTTLGYGQSIPKFPEFILSILFETFCTLRSRAIVTELQPIRGICDVTALLLVSRSIWNSENEESQYFAVPVLCVSPNSAAVSARHPLTAYYDVRP